MPKAVPRLSDGTALKHGSSVKYIPDYLNFIISLYFLPFCNYFQPCKQSGYQKGPVDAEG